MCIAHGNIVFRDNRPEAEGRFLESVGHKWIDKRKCYAYSRVASVNETTIASG